MQKVSKAYQGSDKQVLKNIYLSFFYGAKIGILGLNGSGKSSLLRIIAGVDKNYQGVSDLYSAFDFDSIPTMNQLKKNYQKRTK